MEYLKERSIPFYYLYDEKGSEIYDEITNLEEYYPFKKESELINQYIREMISFDDDLKTEGIYLVEFGAGYSDKTETFILNLLKTYKKVIFVPIDVSESACQVTQKKYQHMKNLEINPYVGTYDQFLDEQLFFEFRVIYIFLGNTIGNFDEDAKIEFLRKASDQMTFRDIFLIGHDTNYKSPEIILNAYNDKSGVTAKFILNILNHLNTKYALNCKLEDFEYLPIWNHQLSRVEISLRCKRTTIIKCERDSRECEIKEDEKIHIEFSHKFDLGMIKEVCSKTNLILEKTFLTDDKYHLMARFIKGTNAIWNRNDYIFKELIGLENLYESPLKFRNSLIFYLGHIYAFYDIKVFNLSSDDPFYQIFERGRDPVVNDPYRCHRTSIIPDSYPEIQEILDYNNTVKNKILNKIESNGYDYNLLTSIEHELMHLETLFYMIRNMKINLYEKVNDFTNKLKSILVNYEPLEKKIIIIPERTLTQGTNETFVWDNEMPKHYIHVNSFRVDNLPVTWREMKTFINDHPEVLGKIINLNEKMEIRVTESTWIKYEDGKDFPAWVNLEVASMYIEWKKIQGINCRLMTENEFDSLASNLNNLTKGNVNFKFLHAVPVGAMKDFSEDGIGELFGNGWELTQTLFRPFDGFVPQENYSEYSQDFFTDIHYVLKGASPFTSLDLLRKSYRNWYQYNYPYHVAKFRLVYL